ncbi:hypothetical protein F5X68DRAFT_229311 [Plectosphaerella plurivora]|uniref:Uncharacterized protein n=1 Tax=Plectosphaerella plurivora TaxID=936078 RepID=A0A9P9AAR3_9PEZI|nr:hypothetical protein F5X68DRAFT_229311 [Plectosphaerella plurivora]
MRPFVPLLLSALGASPDGFLCLGEDEAFDISRRWLDVFASEGGSSSKAELATVVAADIVSIDETFGPPTIGIDDLWDVIVAGDNQTTTNIKYTPGVVLNKCKEISVSWVYTAVTTGTNTSVAAGKAVTFTGIDLLEINLKDRLISKATSSGNWIVLANQLGETCMV